MASFVSSPANWQPDTVHIAFITALEDELEPILRFAPSSWTDFPIDGFPHFFAEINFGATTLNVVACSPREMGEQATTSALHRLHKLKPQVIVMTGICAGWRDKDILQGDVIVADRAYFPEEGKITEEGLLADTRTFEPPPILANHLRGVANTLQWEHEITTPRPHTRQYLADIVLCEMAMDSSPFSDNPGVWRLVREKLIDIEYIHIWLLKESYLDKSGELTEIARSRIKELRLYGGGELHPIAERVIPKVHYRTFATVKSVQAVEGVFKRLEPRMRTIGAIEMEVAAFYKEARVLGYESIFAVKGVQDFGTPDKDDSFRVYAAEAAARWAFSFVREKWNALANESQTAVGQSNRSIPTEPKPSKYGDNLTQLAHIRDELIAHNSDVLVVETYDRILREVEKAWSQSDLNTLPASIENLEEFFDFGDTFRKTLVKSSMTSWANNYSPEMINAAIENGIWETSEAISIVGQLSDARQRADACVAVLRAQVPLQESIQLHRMFFDAAKQFTAPLFYIDALKNIAPILHSDFVEESLSVTRGLHFLTDRAAALATLLGNLDEQRKQIFIRECMNQISLSEDIFERGRALVTIAPHLSDDFIDEAISITEHLSREHERSAVIEAIAPRLNPTQVPTVYQFAINIRDGRERADAIAALASVLPRDLLDNALTHVENVDEIFARNTALVNLSLRIADAEKKQQILTGVFQDIRESNSTFTRSDFPAMWLYPKLPDEFQAEAIKVSFETGTLVGSGLHRAEAFGLALFRICELGDRTDFDDIFERGFSELLHLAIAHCGSLTLLLPYLPEPYKDMAVQTVRDALMLPIVGKDNFEKQLTKKNRITWALRLLPFLSEPERQATPKVIWELAFSLPNQNDRFETLAPVVPLLKGRELRSLLNRLSTVTDFSSRAAALARIGRQLAPSKQHELIDRILTLYLPNMLTEREKALTIARIAGLLRSSQLQICINEITRFEEEGAVATALANIAISAQNPPLDEIFNIALKMYDNDAQALLLEAIAEKLTHEQITCCLAQVNSLQNIQRKLNILHAFAAKLTKNQVSECLSSIQSGNEPLINIVLTTSLYEVMDSVTQKIFLENSVNTILATSPDSAQFGIAWAASCIADFLNDIARQRVLHFACHALAALSGNMATYPGGNPKTNAFKKLIPKLDAEMQRFALSEIQTIPHLGGLQTEDGDPVSEVLAETGADLADELIPTALELLDATDDNWNKVHALELIATRTSALHWNQFMRVAQQLQSGWMRARVWAAFLDKYPRKEEIVKLVRGTLLVHLLQTRAMTREELLWSIDVQLFKEPYLSRITLDKVVNDIIEICDEWN